MLSAGAFPHRQPFAVEAQVFLARPLAAGGKPASFMKNALTLPEKVSHVGKVGAMSTVVLQHPADLGRAFSGGWRCNALDDHHIKGLVRMGAGRNISCTEKCSSRAGISFASAIISAGRLSPRCAPPRLRCILQSIRAVLAQHRLGFYNQPGSVRYVVAAARSFRIKRS